MTIPDVAGEHAGAGGHGGAGGSGVDVGVAGERLSWREDWADTPWPEEAHDGWAHHGLAVLISGRIVGFHPSRPEVLVYEPSGRCVASFPTGLSEGHGITVVEDGGDEQIWIADPGTKMRRGEDGAYRAVLSDGSGQAVRFDLAGTVTLRLRRPEHPAYEEGRYAPTSIAVDEPRHGGSGDIFVADGYGESLVHRFGADGTYITTLTGEAGPGGRFNCPHGILIDRRRDEPELLVADRGNAVVRVYGLDGYWRRDIGGSFLNSPSAFAPWGERMVVAELRARLAVLGADEQLLGYLGENGEICEREGWPNSLDGEGHATRQAQLSPGRFNSPHGLASDGSGNVYVAEWLVGGRMVKLEPLAAT